MPMLPQETDAWASVTTAQRRLSPSSEKRDDVLTPGLGELSASLYHLPILFLLLLILFISHDSFVF